METNLVLLIKRDKQKCYFIKVGFKMVFITFADVPISDP